MSLARCRLRSWLAVRGIPLHAHEAAETLSLSLEAQAALAFEREAGGAERFAFETAVEWCRNKWGGETRQRCAFRTARLLEGRALQLLASTKDADSWPYSSTAQVGNRSGRQRAQCSELS